jgi:tRNA dimethylallyltransferase
LKNKTLISIVGPTAIGKTALSIELAKAYNCEIISADSRQFFKEMSIGTAKPTPEEMNGVVHHFVDCISIQEFYTAGQFENDVMTKLSEIFENQDIAIMVGGSGLYVNAVLAGIDEIPSDLELRNQLNQELEEKGLRHMQQKLKKLDYEHFKFMDKQNPQRLVRAIEVCLTTGKKYSELRNQTAKKREFDIIQVGITADREVIYDRINQRVDSMVKDGLVEEVTGLFAQKELNSLNTVGYKEIFRHLEGEWELDFAIEKIKQNTRNFAKRQLTWFKKDEKTTWFDIMNEKDKLVQHLEKSLK